MKTPSLLLLLTAAFAHAEDPIHLEASQLNVTEHRLETSSGAVLTTDWLRIQAKSLTYIKNLSSTPQQHSLDASGQLMINYGGRILIADSIHYDWLTGEGLIINGITYDNLWLISAEKIAIHADRSLEFFHASISTSEKGGAILEGTAKLVRLTPHDSFSAQHLCLQFAKIPVFYIPYFSMALKGKDKSPISYGVNWNSGQGPQLTMRYLIYSNPTTSIRTRLDLRWNRGVGGALETDYQSSDQTTVWQTREYLAHDTFFNDNQPNQKKTRYRLQGFFSSYREENELETSLTYDKYSDPNMPLDFSGDNFELDTVLKTALTIRKNSPYAAIDFLVTPRINSFQGFKQELPSLHLGFTPIQLGASGLIMEPQATLSWIDYAYNQQIRPNLPSFRSGRLDLEEKLSRPFDLKYLNLTPYCDFRGVFYTNNPEGQAVFEEMLKYGIKASTHLFRHYSTWTHLVEPYANFTTVKLYRAEPRYIFSYEDGYDPYQTLKLGVKNSFSYANHWSTFNLYAYRFFNQSQFSSPFPKIGATVDLDFNRLYLDAQLLMDTQHASIDRWNLSLLWTVNSKIALKAEWLYRSALGFRKVDPEDFTLDVNQNIDQLIASPISDRHHNMNFSSQFNLSRALTLRMESHMGWGRRNQPFYWEYKIDLLGMIATNWKLKISYMRLVNDHQVAFGLNLVPNN